MQESDTGPNFNIKTLLIILNISLIEESGGSQEGEDAGGVGSHTHRGKLHTTCHKINFFLRAYGHSTAFV